MGYFLYIVEVLNSFSLFCVQNAAYLMIRGMKTLHLRVQQQNTTAMRMAEVLEAHPKVNSTLVAFFIKNFSQNFYCIFLFLNRS